MKNGKLRAQKPPKGKNCTKRLETFFFCCLSKIVVTKIAGLELIGGEEKD